MDGTPIPNAFADELNWRTEYNDHGYMTCRVDPAGQVTQYSYTPSADGTIQSVIETPPEGSPVMWLFNEEGQLSEMKDGESDVVYRYDGEGLLNTIERTGASLIHYSYDDVGRIIELTIGDFYRIAWTYDFLNRIEKINTPAGLISYEYQNGNNIVVRSLPNGIKTFWKSKPNGELQEIIHGFFKNQTSQEYSLLAQYTYEHDPEERITSIRKQSAQEDFTRHFGYDTMGRLVTVTGNGEWNYEYDQVGNRIKATTKNETDQHCTYDWAGRLTDVDGKPVQYDSCGNLTEVILDGVKHWYSYHPDGRLAEVQSRNKSTTYRYDGDGCLIARRDSNGEIRFISDPLSSYWRPLVIEEANNKCTLVIWDGMTPLALVRDGEVEWLLHDHLGSVRMVTDARGNVSHTCDYNPFGLPVTKSKKSALYPGFAGLFWDTDANGYLTLARLFSPQLGSFLQPDPQKQVPSEFVQQYSLYQYCLGDPVNLVDIDGASPEPPLGFSQAFLKGRFFGTRFGDEATAYWAQRWAETGNPLYAVPGAFAALWTKETWLDTATTLFTVSSAIKSVRFVQIFRPRPRTSIIKRLGQIFYNSSKHGTIRGNLTTEIKLMEKQGRTPAVGLTPFINKLIKPFLPANLQKIKPLQMDHLWLPNSEKFWKNLPPVLRRLEGFKGGLWNYVEVPGVLNWWFEHGGWLGRSAHYLLRAFVLLEGVAGAQRGCELGTHLKEGFSQIGSLINRDSWLPSLLNQINPFYCSPAWGDEINYQNNGESHNSQLQNFPTDSSITWHGAVVHSSSARATPEEIAAYKAAGKYKAFEPSSVGGVYLGGAGGAIANLGVIKGISRDAKGNLLLIGENEENIKLPAIRLDDLVTVFCSVYLNGEGPTVTIDPNPDNPETSDMIIRHSKATEDTYVGWVLYQADRLMKAYILGEDNITGKKIISCVPGYSEVIEKMYFGNGTLYSFKKEGVWERFWIVPAEARHYESSSRELTLFDIPLKVRTQKMKWENGALVDDFTSHSSPGAQAFSAWFTSNYEAIGAEQYLVPPKESGITEPVPVFTELRRIALMTAIAEKMRDEGVPIPFWMRDYHVQKVPFEHMTPGRRGLEVQQVGNTIQTARIFGGVKLSADKRTFKTCPTYADVAKTPLTVHSRTDRHLKLAERLERVIMNMASTSSEVQQIQDGDHEYNIASLPCTETLALGPCQLDEIDIIIPVTGGDKLQLSRTFNSFFTPKSEWGQSWTMNLPRLVEIRMSGSREGFNVIHTAGYELLTPLNTLYARFKDIDTLQKTERSKLLVPETDGPFRGLTDVRSAFLQNIETRMLLLKNGQEWHFTKSGDLIAVKDGAQLTVYERDMNGSLSRIVRSAGSQLAGDIKLEYDANNRIATATGSLFKDNQSESTVEVTYSYDATGRLNGVTSNQGTVGYHYDGLQVSEITWAEKNRNSQPIVLRSVKYNAQGQVLSEKIDDRVIEYKTALSPEGLVASTCEFHPGGKTMKTLMHYDRDMRPVKAVTDNGNTISWSYPSVGGVETTLATDTHSVSIEETADGRRRTISSNGTPWITALFDDGGRLTSLEESAHTVLSQEWRSDGQLSSVKNTTHEATLYYDAQDLLSSIELHPANKSKNDGQWQRTKVDQNGRPIELSDSSGLHIVLRYDELNAIASVAQQTPDGKEEFE